jgi:hypothetical protein
VGWLALCLAGAANAHAFKIVGAPDQVAQIERSLSACQTLTPVLDGLAQSGRLRQIRIADAAEVGKAGPFRATASADEIIFTADWLAEQAVPAFDVRGPNDILPDNLCFGIGHLADHLKNAGPLSPAAAGNPAAWAAQRLRAESLAYLHGWSYVLAAAQAKNDGRPLNAKQAVTLMLNLRYRYAFLGALSANASPKLEIHDDGAIPETENNIAAVSAVVGNASVPDLE